MNPSFVARCSMLDARRLTTDAGNARRTTRELAAGIEHGALRRLRLLGLDVERRASSGRQAAFSMIEIALSLAIIGIGLLSIVGVLPALLNSSRGAIEQSEIAMAAQNFVEYDYASKRAPIDLPSDSPLGTVTTNYVSSSLQASNIVTYVTATNAFLLVGAAFKDKNSDPLLKTMRIIYSWPQNAPPAKRQTFTFITEIAATTNITMGP